MAEEVFVPGPEFVFFKYVAVHLGNPGHLVEARVIASGEVAAEFYPVNSNLRVPVNFGALPDIARKLERVAHFLEIPGRIS